MDKFSSVSRLKYIAQSIDQTPDDEEVRAALSKVFGYDGTNVLEAYEYSIAYYNLVDRVVDVLSNACAIYPFLAHSLKEIEPLKKLALHFNNSRQWRHCNPTIGASTILALETAEGFYEMYVEKVEVRVEDSHIEGLKEKVNDLYASVNDSDLPRDLKLKIHDYIIEIKKSLVKYSVHGVEGIEKSMSTLFGFVGLNKEIVNDEDQPHVFDDMRKVFFAFKAMTELANTVLSLPGNIQGALTSLTEISEKFK